MKRTTSLVIAEYTDPRWRLRTCDHESEKPFGIAAGSKLWNILSAGDDALFRYRFHLYAINETYIEMFNGA